MVKCILNLTVLTCWRQFWRVCVMEFWFWVGFVLFFFSLCFFFPLFLRFSICAVYLFLPGDEGLYFAFELFLSPITNVTLFLQVRKALRAEQTARGQRDRRHIQGFYAHSYQLPKLWTRGMSLNSLRFSATLRDDPYFDRNFLHMHFSWPADSQSLHFEPFKQLMLPLPAPRQAPKQLSVVFFPVRASVPQICTHRPCWS